MDKSQSESEQQVVTRTPSGEAAPKRVAPRKPAKAKGEAPDTVKVLPRRSTLGVTIATQRSGTKLLGSCLNAGVKVRSLGEVLHQNASPIYSFSSFLLRQPSLAQEIGLGRTWEFLDRYTLELSVIAPYIHFDLMYGNLSYLAPLWLSRSTGLPMVDYLMSRDVAIVHLVRDPVDTYISGIVASCTAVYHSTGSGGSAVIEVPDSLIQQTMRDQPMSAYLEQTMKSREAVRHALLGYAHVLEVDYNQVLDRDGFLSRGVREGLASLLTNGDDPKLLQVTPTVIRRPNVDVTIYQRVRDKLAGA